MLRRWGRRHEDPGRHQRLQLSRMERGLLSGPDQAGADARALRPAARHGRDQQHVLPHAQARRRRQLGRPGSGRLPVRDQSVAAPDPSPAAPGHRRTAGLSLRQHRPAGRTARLRPVPIAAVPARRPRPARRLPGPPARGRAERVRIQARILARRTGLRAAARGQRRAGRRRHRRGTTAGADRDRRLGLFAPAPQHLRRRRPRPLAAADSNPGLAARFMDRAAAADATA